MSEVKTSSGGMRIGGASIAWVTLYGALCGVTALIPIFPYVGGGGYVPLQTMFSAIAPLLLGELGGFIAAVLGGVIGMFVAPAAFPLGLVDVILTGALPALCVGLTINSHKRWLWAAIFAFLMGLIFTFFPFYIPGKAADFNQPENFAFWALINCYYWLIPVIILVSPLGRRYIPEWARSHDRKKAYLGIFLGILTGLMFWWLPWADVYAYVFHYEPALSITVTITYMWWVLAFSLVVAIIAIPLLEALRRSGLPKISGALWW